MWPQDIYYENLELLGEGGQARVFKALRRDRASGLSDTVALKILHSETAVELWKKEFESLRKVRSPYCVQVMAFDRVRRRPALILEFVDGVSLLQLGRTCVLDPSDVREVCAQIEAGLKDLLAFGIVHGDLSPGNVMVDRKGQIKLLDFGLANTGGAQMRLTPQFASPERMDGAAPTILDDLYSLRQIESYLLGRSLSPSREWRAVPPNTNARERLSRKVDGFLRHSVWAKKFKTRTHAVLRARAPRVYASGLTAVLMALLISASSRSESVVPAKVGTLKVRTRFWHHLSIDGHAAGYAPLEITVPASRPVRIDWKNARGTGQRRLHLKPGQLLLLEDRDF